MASPVTSLASWNALERAIDRWVSMGALALAVGVGVVYLLLQ